MANAADGMLSLNKNALSVTLGISSSAVAAAAGRTPSTRHASFPAGIS